MVIEEVRFDFEEFRLYADDFIYNLLKLMIISKMNSTFNDASSRQYFVNLIQQIDCCEAYVVRYGQPIYIQNTEEWNLVIKKLLHNLLE